MINEGRDNSNKEERRGEEGKKKISSERWLGCHIGTK